MSEQEWAEYQALLEQSSSGSQTTCIGCWYEQNPDGQFPGDTVSSGLCDDHADHLPASIKPATAV
jgi:hypothetical protein